MPRLPWSFIKLAWRENNLLPSLLRATRDLDSARLELGWLQEHVGKSVDRDRNPRASSLTGHARNSVRRLARARSRGVPLQYLLGTEYFGSLELLCKPGVLIPRWETAASVQYLLQKVPEFASRLSDEPRILDLCTGTGCIPLLISAEYPYTQTSSNRLRVLGIDISSKALNLAHQNRTKVISDLRPITEPSGPLEVDVARFTTFRNMRFLQGDVLAEQTDDKFPRSQAVMSLLNGLGETNWDIVTSNPPYISPRSFSTTTTRSVRNFEPKLALVPPSRTDLSDTDQGDMFYPRIEKIARAVQAKILLVEVADMAQAQRVVSIVRGNAHWRTVEIWCDEPGARVDGQEITSVDHMGTIMRGLGNGRSVFCCSFEL